MRFAWTLVAVTLLAGCGTPGPRLVGDGTTQVFSYKGGVPMPAKNDWIEMTIAGTALSTEGANADNIPFWWNFAFKAQVADIKSVSIFDVTQSPPVLVLKEEGVSLADGSWMGSSATQKLSKATAPWLSEPGPTEHIFKIVLVNSAGDERTLYQPCLHSASLKKMLLNHIASATATK